jgi:methyl-accepting chemotaxis protein
VRQGHWQREIKPTLTERVTEKSTREEVKGDLDTLESRVKEQIERVNAGMDLAFQVARENIARFRLYQIVFAGIGLVVIGGVLGITRGLARRTRSLARTADRIATGELTLRANVGGSDELAVLGEAFDTMTEKLRGSLEAEQANRARIETLLETEQESRARIEKLLGSE